MTTNKATYSSTRGNGNSSAGVNKGHAFTHDDPPAPFGWQGEKHARRAAQAPPRASARSLGQMETGQLKEFQAGMHDAWDKKARTAAVMVGTYAAVRGLQHWSAWKRQQGCP
jgi:hypothetical protein